MENNFKEVEFDETLDALLSLLDGLPKETVKMLDSNRYRLMFEIAAELAKLLKFMMSEGEINIEIDQMFNLGSISIELESLTVDDPIAFAKLIYKADNFEIYPLTNGNIKLDITFQSVLKSIA